MSEDRLRLLEKMIASGSTDPFHHYAHAMELRSVGRLDDALEAFREVAERFEDYVPTYLMAAQVAQELERDEEAASFARRGVERAEARGDGHAAGELRAFLALVE